MKPYSEDALVYIFSLEAGMASVADVNEWAKAQVEASDDYDDDLMNVFLAEDSPAAEVLTLLRLLADTTDEWAAMRRTMGKMHDILLQDSNRAQGFAKYLDAFCARNGSKVPDDMAFMAGINDSFSLAEQGTAGPVEEATTALIESLSCFKQ